MFSIFKKRSTIILDCFTPIPELPDLFPIVQAQECMPEWFKQLPATVPWKGINRGSMKMSRCHRLLQSRIYFTCVA
jgi:hypothetical protein